jgi:F-type H+-transporting ATPase subunit gamma
MAKLREVKKRIKAVANIARITKTMQMIATAKFQASVRRAQATQPFTRKIAELAADLAAAGGDIEHPLLSPPAEKTHRELVLVLTSNRGLCGAYNANVLRAANGFLRSATGRQIDLEVVGKKGSAYFRFAGIPVQQSHTQFTDKPSYEAVEKIASRFMEAFESRRYDAVRVVYTQFISNARQTPRVLQLLPMEPPKATGDKKHTTGYQPVYEFSPDPQTLLGALLPLAVKSQLFQAFNDAVVSEQIARMVAMKAATDNATKMGRSLKRLFNRARQTQITTELTEIIGGAAALE